MRLFGKVDGTIDRFDRAGWMTGPFDLAFAHVATGPFRVSAGQGFNSGLQAAQGYTPTGVGQGFNSGSDTGQVWNG